MKIFLVSLKDLTKLSGKIGSLRILYLEQRRSRREAQRVYEGFWDEGYGTSIVDCISSDDSLQSL